MMINFIECLQSVVTTVLVFTHFWGADYFLGFFGAGLVSVTVVAGCVLT